MANIFTQNSQPELPSPLFWALKNQCPVHNPSSCYSKHSLPDLLLLRWGWSTPDLESLSKWKLCMVLLLIISACLLAMTLAKDMKPMETPAGPYGKRSHRHFLKSRENISHKSASLLKSDWQKERAHGLLTHTAPSSPTALYYFVNSSLIFYYYCYWMLWRGCNLSSGEPTGPTGLLHSSHQLPHSVQHDFLL